MVIKNLITLGERYDFQSKLIESGAISEANMRRRHYSGLNGMRGIFQRKLLFQQFKFVFKQLFIKQLYFQLQQFKLFI